MTPPSATLPRRSSGRLFLALGVGLAALGLVGYLVQVLAMQRLIAPWYVPFAATLGVIFVVVSLFQRRSVTRVLVLLLLVVLAGAEWTFLLGARLPAYTGPVEVGQKLPQFKSTRADGTSFAQQDLEGGSNTVMVFFRGRW